MSSAPPVARTVRGTARRVTRGCALALVLGGLAVLMGWWTESSLVVRPHEDLPAMGAGASACLVLVGLAMLAALRGWSVPLLLLALLSAVVPALDLLDWALHRDHGAGLSPFSDRWPTFDAGGVKPGRLSPGAALSLLCLSVALGAVRSAKGLAHAAALVAGLLGLLGFSTNLYSSIVLSSAVTQPGGSPGVAPHGAALLIVASVGILALLPQVGVMGVLGEPGRIGAIVRRVAVVAVVLPLLVGLLGMLGIRVGRYDATFAVGLVSTSWTAALLMVLWWGGLRAIPVEREGELSRDEAVAGRDRLALLAEVSSAFAATPDLDETLDRVTRRVAHELSAATSVRLIDPTGRLLVLATGYHPDPARQAAFLRMVDREVHVDQGLAGQVLSLGVQGMLEHEVRQTPAIAADPDFLKAVDEYGPPSVAVAALRAGGEPIGVIAVVRDRGDSPLVQADLDLLTGLADRAAQAIHNAQLVADQARQDAAFARFAADALVTHTPAELRALAVRNLAEALQARHALLLEPDGEERPTPALVVTAATEADGVPAMPIGAAVAAPVPLGVLRTGEPYVCADLRHDVSPEMVSLAETLDIDSGLAVAVPGRGGPRGVLTVASVGLNRFSEDEVDLGRAFAGLLSGALQRMEAEASLARVAEERQALLDRLVSAQEDERARIADGVHQDQVQVIAAADLRLGVLARRAGELDPGLAEDLTFAREAVTGAAERLRALLFELEPPDPTADLDEAVAEAAAYLLDPVGTEWTVYSESTARLDQSHLTTAYRIAKEALANAARHARAARVEIRVRDVDGGVSVQVRDDGVGMTKVPVRSVAGHLGISSIRDWVDVAGGRLRIDSTPGEGTVVDFWLPTAPDRPSAAPSQALPG